LAIETGLIQVSVYFLPDFLADVDQYLLDLSRRRRAHLSRSNLVSLALKEYLANHPVEAAAPVACAE
jgi:hypothetical protein